MSFRHYLTSPDAVSRSNPIPGANAPFGAFAFSPGGAKMSWHILLRKSPGPEIYCIFLAVLAQQFGIWRIYPFSSQNYQKNAVSLRLRRFPDQKSTSILTPKIIYFAPKSMIFGPKSTQRTNLDQNTLLEHFDKSVKTVPLSAVLPLRCRLLRPEPSKYKNPQKPPCGCILGLKVAIRLPILWIGSLMATFKPRMHPQGGFCGFYTLVVSGYQGRQRKAKLGLWGHFWQV